MKTVSAFLLAMCATAAFAAPAALEKRCYVGDADPDVIDKIYRAALSRGVNSKVRVSGCVARVDIN